MAPFQYEIPPSSIYSKSSKPITLSIPTNKLDQKQIARAFMSNMIHSMDAANIHLLINFLDEEGFNTPLYTIHDCFATTPNNMLGLNNSIKTSFIKLYFNKNYIEKFHESILEQLDSYGITSIITDTGQKCYISEDQMNIVPELPKELLERWEKNKGIFIQGLKRSEYFIS
jgi:DNA-directed RNA polymerase